MSDLNSYLASRQNLINSALEKFLCNLNCKSRLLKAMRYSLMSNGKRIRPILCLAACEAVGGDKQTALTASCAIEMIHTYSLIHDDLPAMDNDSLRRGRPACHIEFDEATALLAGDSLLTYAFQILSSLTMPNSNNSLLLKYYSIINSIAKASGFKGMIEGQMRDIASENRVITLKELESMHSLKTGALIEASAYTGAVLGCGTDKQIDHLSLYSKKIGLAFQIADDILNVEGDPLLMGKASGTDTILNKNTYPSFIGLEPSKKYMKKLVDTSLKSLEIFDKKADPLRKIACYVIERKR